MNAPLILAIDGGGSKTLVALADRAGEARLLPQGAGINPMDNPLWRERLAEALAPALDRSADIAGAVAALPAYGEIAALSAAQETAMAALLGPIRHRIMNDVDAAHFGAFAGGAGILMLAGTGSMAWASDGKNPPVRVGGFGEAIGDEGSAYWIGLRAIKLTSRIIDGRIAGEPFVDALYAALGLDRSQPLDALMGWHSTLEHPRSQIAALAPLVDRLALSGDPIALSIVAGAADHLAQHVHAAARRINAGANPAWSFAGGVFRSQLLLDALASRIGSQPRLPVLPPIGGALLRAARDLDWPVDQAWIERLAASIENTHATRGMAVAP